MVARESRLRRLCDDLLGTPGLGLRAKRAYLMMQFPSALPLPVDQERARVAALHACGILEPRQESRFDALIRTAAQAVGAPAALLTLIDADRQVFKARFGIDARASGLECSLCYYTIKGADVLYTPDARLDVRFANNPWVTGHPGIRFYAGTPLVTEQGDRIGSLCVLDFRPRYGFSAADAQVLEGFARHAMAETNEGQRAPYPSFGQRSTYLAALHARPAGQLSH